MPVKINIAHPQTGCQKVIEVDDERKLHAFLEKRIAAEVPGDSLGDQYKGYVFKITGGYDKEGFAMHQGVLLPGRVRLLLAEGSPGFTPRRDGQRRRKSVRGCITSADMTMINVVIVKKGDEELPGITDGYVPSRRGPKRANKIRKLFALEKNDDVRKYVIRRALPPSKKEKAALEAADSDEARKKIAEGFKKRTRAPKIQRLVTPLTLQRRRHRLSLKKRTIANRKAQQAEYAKLLAQRAAARRESQVSARRSRITSQKVSQRASVQGDAAKATAGAPAAATTKKAAAPAAKPTAATPKGAPAKSDKPAAKKAAAPAAGKGKGKPAAASTPAATTTAAKPAPKAAAKPAGKAKK